MWESIFRERLDDVRHIAARTAVFRDDPWNSLLGQGARLMLDVADWSELVDAQRWSCGGSPTLDEIVAVHRRVFDETSREGYESCWANPAYAASQLGLEHGRTAAVFYAAVCRSGMIGPAMTRDFRSMARALGYFTEAYEWLRSHSAASVVAVRSELTRFLKDESDEDAVDGLLRQYDPQRGALKRIMEESDPGDLRHLYRYPVCVTEHEIATARFFSTLPAGEIRAMARTIVEAYVRGFKAAEKDISAKSTIRMLMRVGHERLGRELFRQLRKIGLEPLMWGVEATQRNPQVSYDHRFDQGLFLDDSWADRRIASMEKAYQAIRPLTSRFSGVIWVEGFGEEPFSPVSKPEAVTLDETQQAVQRRLQSSLAQIQNRSMPREERSFCIIAYPTPEIGPRFEEIFRETIKINTLDVPLYQGIQQNLIDALDKADHVVVKGSSGNMTDIRVSIATLADPTTQTAFENCGADVNIPVGEVFTSPVLKGTTGVLHVPQIYLEGLNYVDLKITFTDGWVTDYSCGNFADAAENKKYIEENLLFPHKTLPLGEFAIGTNTLAYVIAKRFDIMKRLPVLIIEKMGPHFAIGDTCYSFEEDAVTRNPNGKIIMAKDNDKTILRKTEPDKAYTRVHTDITLPYEGIGLIAAVTKSGEQIPLIRDGRFVLPGTELLNKAFE